MTLKIENVEFNCSFNYKQLKICTKDWLYGSTIFLRNNNTKWHLQVDRSDPTQIGIYLTLMDGAPCVLHSYTISMMTNTNPSVIIFNNRCTLQRIFPSNRFSWGFPNFCTRYELKNERDLICHPKTKFVTVRCTMQMEVFDLDNNVDDHRLATDLFHIRSLEQWIEFLKTRQDLPELNNRVNEEIEARL